MKKKTYITPVCISFDASPEEQLLQGSPTPPVNPGQNTGDSFARRNELWDYNEEENW